MAEKRNIAAALGLCVGGPLLMLLLVELISNVFERMAIFYALVVPVALLAARPPKILFRFDLGLAALGVALGALMYGAGWVGYAVMRLVAPDFAATAATFYGWLDAGNGLAMWLMIVWVIVGEEIVWRVAVTLPLAARWKGAGVAVGTIGFVAVHVPWGPPLLLLAALVFGACWGVIAWKTKNFWCVLISHLVWDALVMNLARYA